MREGFRCVAANVWIFVSVPNCSFQSDHRMGIGNRLHGVRGGGTVEGSPTSLEGCYQLFCHSVAVDVPNLLSRFKRASSTLR